MSFILCEFIFAEIYHRFLNDLRWTKFAKLNQHKTSRNNTITFNEVKYKFSVKPAAVPLPLHPATYLPLPLHPATYLPLPLHPATYLPLPLHPATYLPLPLHPAIYLPLPLHPATYLKCIFS